MDVVYPLELIGLNPPFMLAGSQVTYPRLEGRVRIPFMGIGS